MRASTIPSAEPRKVQYIRRSDRVVSFDSDNAYPKRTKQILEASPTALACRNLFCRFVKGNGFIDESLNQIITHPNGQRLFQLLNLIIKDYANHGYFAVHFNYNLLGQITTMTRVEPLHLRLGVPDSYGVTNYVALWDSWTGKSQMTPDPIPVHYVDLYSKNPEHVLLQIDRDGGIENYKGQVFVYMGDDLSYPMPLYGSVLREMQTEEAIGKYNFNQLEKGFIAKHVISYEGEFTDDRRKMVKREFRKMSGPQGDDIIVIDGVGVNGVRVDALNHSHKDNLYGETEAAVRAKIMRAWGQNPILHGDFRPGSLGQSTEIQNAFQFYNLATVDYRDMFSRTLTEIMERFINRVDSDFLLSPLTFEENGNGSQLGSE